MSSTFTIDLSSRRGCTPNRTFVYEVIETSPNIKYLRQDIRQPKSAKKGGCKTYEFVFECDMDVQPAKSFVQMSQKNMLGEHLYTLTYHVNPANPQPWARLTSTIEVKKDAT